MYLRVPPALIVYARFREGLVDGYEALLDAPGFPTDLCKQREVIGQAQSGARCFEVGDRATQTPDTLFIRVLQRQRIADEDVCPGTIVGCLVLARELERLLGMLSGDCLIGAQLL